MHRTRTSAIAASTTVALTLVAVFALLATGVLGRSGVSAPQTPSKPPPSAPSAPPRPSSTPRAPETPTPDYRAGVRVPLKTATGETVAVYVRDASGMLVGAVSGEPREDVSVGADKVVVRQLDAQTLKVVWADTAINEDVSLVVDRAGGTLRIGMIRRHMSPDIEIAHERVVLLRFETAVNADGVAASIRNSIDTGD